MFPGRQRLMLVVVLVLVLVVSVVGSFALPRLRPSPAVGVSAAQTEAAARALAWLKAQQQADGSLPFGDFTASLTVQAVAAIVAAGESPADWQSDTGSTPMDYLAAQAASVSTPGQLGRLIVAAQGAGDDPRSVGGVDLVARLVATYDAATGNYGAQGNVAEHTLAMVGLWAVDEAIPAEAVQWLAGAQNEDGGWGWATGQPSDASSTAWAVQALLCAGRPANDAALQLAVGYLRTLQNPDGGFASQKPAPAWGTEDSDANSTAAVIQALCALGDRPAGWAWREPAGAVTQSPLARLLAFQRPDGGLSFLADGESDPLATVQAIPALLEKPLAYRPAAQ